MEKVMESDGIWKDQKSMHPIYWYFSITQSSFGPKDTKLLCV